MNENPNPSKIPNKLKIPINHEVPEESVAKPKKYIILFPTVILLIISATLNGILFSQNLQLKNRIMQDATLSSPIPSPLEIVSDENNPVIDWQTYINTKYGYSFKYPADSVLETSLPGIAPKTKPDENSKYFDLRTEEVMIYVHASDYFAILINTDQWEEPDKVVVNNLIAEVYKNRKVETTEDKILYRFRNQEKEIQVDFILTYDKNTQNTDTFDQILSTFRMIDDEKNPKNICESHSGTWLGTYNECEIGTSSIKLNKEQCEEAGGIFKDCESPCRHSPLSQMCAAVCTEVCSF